MSFFRSGSGKGVRAVWTYHSSVEIWRIFPTGSIWMVGEERDVKEKRVRFFCLNRMTGALAWSKALLDDWWVGVEAVTEEAIILHGFATPDMPMHKGIAFVDLSTGRVLWQCSDLAFEGLGDDTVVGSRGSHGKRRYSVLETGSGQVLREYTEEEPSDETMKATGLPPGSVLYPIVTMKAEFNTPAAVQKIFSEQGTELPVAWIQSGSATVLSFQRLKEGQLTEQVLSVRRNKDGDEVFTDRIATEVLIPDSFLLQDEMLYFVRARKDLVAVNLETVIKGEQNGRR